VTRSARTADVRFYVDADLLGLAKLLASLRADVTFPGDPGAIIKHRERPLCPVSSPAILDTTWIPLVAAAGWLIITRDRHIQHHRAEIAAVRDNGAKMVALSGRDALDTWAQLEIVMAQWRPIEELAEHPGPFIYSISRSAVRAVALD
jgi:hypothetical protein